MEYKALVDKINEIEPDLKSEVVLAELLEQGVNTDHINVFFDGQFERAYMKDLLYATLFDDEKKQDENIGIHICRDSLYDMLPEGVTHLQRNERLGKSVREMTSEYRVQKKEEEAAREFFNPFENEFFLYRTLQEIEEKKILFKINSSYSGNFFYKFWNIDKRVNKTIVFKLIRILPYAHKIVGDLEQTSTCLEYLLNEKVEVMQLGFKDQTKGEDATSLGEVSLGIDFISGTHFMDHSLYVDFRIGPIQNTAFMEYVHEGELITFVNTFYCYFLPLEIDAKTTIILPKESLGFSMDDRDAILGFTTTL